MADTTEKQRLSQLKEIDNLLKNQQKLIKDLGKEKKLTLQQEDKLIAAKKEVNKLLKEQGELQRKVKNNLDFNKKHTKKIADYSKDIQDVWKLGEKFSGITGNLWSKIGDNMAGISDTNQENLDLSKNIASEEFKQLSYKEKMNKIDELEQEIKDADLQVEKGIGPVKEKRIKDAMLAQLEADKKTIASGEAQSDIFNSQNEAMMLGNDLTGGLVTGASKWAKQIAKNPLIAVITIAALIITKFSKSLDEIGQNFGAIGLQSKEFTSEMMIASAEAIRLGKNMQDITNSMGILTKDFGIGNTEAVAMAGSFIDTSVALGLSVEEGTRLIATLEQTTGMGFKQSEEFAKQVYLLSEMNNVAPVDVLQDIAGSSEVFAKFSDASGKNIAETAIFAKKLGVELNTVAGIASGLLDFESSLNKEIEASVLLGRQLNFQRARELALQNDQVGMMQEVIKQLGSEEELLGMNVFQREALAGALGVGVDQLSKFIDNQKTANGIAGELADQDISDMIGEEALSNLASLTNSFKSLAAILVETFVPVLEPMMWLLDATIGNLLRFANAIKIVLLPALAAWAISAAVAAFSTAGLVSAATLGFGIAGIILGMASFSAFMSANKPKRFATLPQGQMASIQTGTAIADPGESIVHTDDLASTGGASTQEIKGLRNEMVAVKDAIKSLSLQTKITNKELNIVLTPENG